MKSEAEREVKTEKEKSSTAAFKMAMFHLGGVGLHI